jgi:hypothetical protein
MGDYMHIVQKSRKEIHNAETEKYVSYRRSAPVRKQRIRLRVPSQCSSRKCHRTLSACRAEFGAGGPSVSSRELDARPARLDKQHRHPSQLSWRVKRRQESLQTFVTKNAGYGVMIVTRPQTVSYGLSDSPVGLAAWIYDKFAQSTYSGG